MEGKIQNGTVRDGRRGVLGALREAQIVQSKPVLPAEILSLILDLLDSRDLMRCARASKRLREMAYDDTRWVRRLRLMGVWSEAAARTNADSSVLSQTRNATKPSVGLRSAKTTFSSQGAPLIVLNSPTASKQRLSDDHASYDMLRDGFSEVVISPPSSTYGPRDLKPGEYHSIDVDILTKVRSERGKARREYSRVHKVLNPLYQDASKIVEPSHAEVFKVFRDPEHQAKMVSQLLRFSEADIALGWQNRKNSMMAVHVAFEEAIFAEFEDAYCAEDQEERMKKYARVLYHLDGGKRAANTFINNSSIIASPYKIGDALDCVSGGPSPKFRPDAYLQFLRRLVALVSSECHRIDQIFPAVAGVTDLFMIKMVDAVLHPFLDKLVCGMREAGVEQFVETVSSTYLQTSGFIESICQNHQLRNSSILGDKFQSIYIHFIPDYLDEEVAWFKEQCEAEISGWEKQLCEQNASIEALFTASVTRQADKRDFLSSFKKAVMAPVNILPTFSFGSKSTTSANQSAAPSRPTSPVVTASLGPESLHGPSIRHNRPASVMLPPPGNANIPSTELDAKAAIMQSRLEGIKTLFSLEVALNLVHLAKTSMERIAVFATTDNKHQKVARTRCESVFVHLLRTLGDRHIRSGFTQALGHLSDYDARATRVRPDSQMVTSLVTFVELVNVGDLIQQMVDVFFEEELVNTKLTDKNDFLSDTVKSKKKFEQMLDENVAAGLNRGIEVLMSEVEYICATTQGAGDYNPEATGRNSVTVDDISTTETARRVVSIVQTHLNMLSGSTDKTVLDVFNQEIGLRLFSVICKHVKRQRVSVTGAPRLMSDMNHYFAFVQTMKNTDLQQYFKALCELSPIYLIDGQSAKELAVVIADHDRYSGIFGAEEVLEFAERRADWYLIRAKVEKAMYGIGCHAM